MFAGGEFYDDQGWLLETPTNLTQGMTFLYGGKACLMVISRALHNLSIHKILLPAYLCPTILNTLEHCGLTCEYYQINPDFSIDLDDLSHKLGDHQAVYFINYFGFLQPIPVREYLIALRQQGILLVEDNAQAGFVRQPTGDFIFNSIRKLAAYDGGYMQAPIDVQPIIASFYGTPNHRLPLIRAYRQRLADYLLHDADSYEELAALYEQAEAAYDADWVVGGDAKEQWGIEHLDWQRILQTRRDNYRYLSGLLAKVPQLTPVFPTLHADNMPLGFPVYLQDFDRDGLFDALGEAGIGTTIHWDAILFDPHLNSNPRAVDMASRILTLPIDQRTSHDQLDYMVEVIYHFIQSKVS